MRTVHAEYGNIASLNNTSCEMKNFLSFMEDINIPNVRSYTQRI